MQRNIYVASSWGNPAQREMVGLLRSESHTVYDFRHPAPDNDGFHWEEIDAHWRNWTAAKFIAALDDCRARSGFEADLQAMKWADTCVLLLPCGKSAHLEAGWFAGAGRAVHIVLAWDLPRAHLFRKEVIDPELMYKLATAVHPTAVDCVTALRSDEP